MSLFAPSAEDGTKYSNARDGGSKEVLHTACLPAFKTHML